jgi:ABC-2 type transport system ATP-binding protein
MDRGQIIARGTHDQLVKIVGELDRINLVLGASSEQLLTAWRSTDGVHQVSAVAQTDEPVLDGAVTLLVDDSNIVLPRILEEATNAGVRVTSIDIQEPNLEAVFLHLTGRALRD